MNNTIPSEEIPAMHNWIAEVIGQSPARRAIDIRALQQGWGELQFNHGLSGAPMRVAPGRAGCYAPPCSLIARNTFSGVIGRS